MGHPSGNHKTWPLQAVWGILRRVRVGGETGLGGPTGAGSTVAWVSVGWLWITCGRIWALTLQDRAIGIAWNWWIHSEGVWGAGRVTKKWGDGLGD